MNSRRKFIKYMSALGTVSLIPTTLISCSDNRPGNEVKAMSNTNFVREIPLMEEYDVIVCGGGPSGTVAALAAKREGLKVLLVEGLGQLGGMATSGHVSHWLGGRTQEGEWVVQGLFKTIAEEAAKKGYAVIPSLSPNKDYHPYGWYNWFIHGIPLDPFSIDYFLDEKMGEAGVDVLLFTYFVDTVVEGDRITQVILYNRSGLFAVPTKAVIDATGNAEVAYRSNCETMKGRKEDGKMTPTSLVFHAYNVNEQELTQAIEKNRDPKFRDLIRQLREIGEWTFPYDIFICTRLPAKGEFYINTCRLVGIDGTDGRSVSEGMKRGREETHQLMSLFQKYFPGFKNARIKSVASQLGVRETRRIIGDYVMTVEDLKNDKVFDDCIGFSMYGWDLPDPNKPSVQPFADDEKTGFKQTVQKGLTTPLPFRIMIPKTIKNLICPGRAVSVEGQVLGPVRVMAPCMAMGEAAGIATKQVVMGNASFTNIDIEGLRARLKEAGAIIDREQLPVIYPRVDQI
ncbi:FAD-dependent oxidoreductase [Parabacteroides sp. Marseille-P3160]|uniref:FAD-dependent oxidoreductase n=1 Tax=Parabacteroides sp. Marseille-P3160 TaxID=1917887 RepID=UPI0009BC5E4E|nr:FAD-dependent oxidoreductase [Parabacteroides sp. Marseille-P3160]